MLAFSPARRPQTTNQTTRERDQSSAGLPPPSSGYENTRAGANKSILGQERVHKIIRNLRSSPPRTAHGGRRRKLNIRKHKRDPSSLFPVDYGEEKKGWFSDTSPLNM